MPTVKSTLSAVISLLLGATLLATDAGAQTLRERIVGAWTMVSAHSVQPDGSRVEVFGPNPKGTMIFTQDGQFALVQMRAELPKIAANSRDQATPEEYKAIVQGSIAYFGTYTFQEADKTLLLKLEGSTFANQLAQAEQRRLITSLTSEELRFANLRTPSGTTLEVSWKRAQ